MGFSDIDTLAINTIRTLAVRYPLLSVLVLSNCPKLESRSSANIPKPAYLELS